MTIYVPIPIDSTDVVNKVNENLKEIYRVMSTKQRMDIRSRLPALDANQNVVVNVGSPIDDSDLCTVEKFNALLAAL